jgi:uncharacterized membrane protein
MVMSFDIKGCIFCGSINVITKENGLFCTDCKKETALATIKEKGVR